MPGYLEPMKTLEFEIDSDLKSVYNAWLDLEVFKQWFCPTGFTLAKAEMDAKPGGFFRMHMESPDGEIYPTKGEYILLEKSRRIVYKDAWDDDRKNNEPVVCEVRFEPSGRNTKISLYSSFASEKIKEKALAQDVTSGWKMFFNNLNKALRIH